MSFSVSVDLSSRKGAIRPLHGVNNGPKTTGFYRDASKLFREAGIPLCRLHDTEYPFGSGAFVDIPCIFKNWDAAEYERLIKEFDLPVNKAYKDFSRGMKMKLGIAVAMSHNAKLLLLDEHTAALDPATAAKVLELTEKIVAEDKLTTVMITHNMTDAIKHGNRLIMMDSGRIVLDISGEEKSRLTKRELLDRFAGASGKEEENDALVLS